MGEDSLWDRRQAILSCWSAACQRPDLQEGSAGREGKAQAGRPLLFGSPNFLQYRSLENPSPSSHPGGLTSNRWNGWDFLAGKRITLPQELQQKSQSRFSLDTFVSHTRPSTNDWGPGTDHPIGQTKSHAQLWI